jgi:ribosomal small subunit protein bTHX
MGKGDQRSKRGKIHRGTFGRRRPKPKTHKPGAGGAAVVGGPDTAPGAKTKEPKIVKKQPKE